MGKLPAGTSMDPNVKQQWEIASHGLLEVFRVLFACQ